MRTARLRAAAPAAGGRRRAGRVIAGWHAGRLLAYVVVGAALGIAGQGLAGVLRGPVARALPWLMVAGFAGTAFELGRRLRPLPGIAAVARAVARLGARLPGAARAVALGAATPLLPCGLLYGLFVAAIGAGTAAGGATVMGLFGLGGVPALAGVQLGRAWTGRHPRAELWLRRAVPLAAAVVIAWRALAAPASGAMPCH